MANMTQRNAMTGRVGLGAAPFTGAQYISSGMLPTPPPFSVPGVTPPTPQEWADIIGYQTPISGAGAAELWNEYIGNAYHGRLPPRLREVNAAIHAGVGLSDEMVNRVIYEDAQWGGSMQDVPTSAIVESRGQYPGGNPMAYAGGPGSGNAERLFEDQLGTDVYKAPVRTAPATQYGPLTTVAQNLGRASDRGVPTSVAQDAADFDANLQAARYEQGDLPTDTGPGLFTPLLSLTGPAGVFLSGAAGSVASDNPFGVIATPLATWISAGRPMQSSGGSNPDALNFGDNAATNLYRPDALTDAFDLGLPTDSAPLSVGAPGSAEYFDLFGGITPAAALPLPNLQSLPELTGWDALTPEEQWDRASLWGSPESYSEAAASLDPFSNPDPVASSSGLGLLSSAVSAGDGQTQSANPAPVFNVGGAASRYTPSPPPPPPDLPVYFDLNQNPFSTRALGGF